MAERELAKLIKLLKEQAKANEQIQLKVEEILALQEKFHLEMSEELRILLTEQTAQAALGFDNYLRAVLKQRMATRRLKLKR